MILFMAPGDWFKLAPPDPTCIHDGVFGDYQVVASEKAHEIVAAFNGRICEGLSISTHSGMWLDFETAEDLVMFRLYW